LFDPFSHALSKHLVVKCGLLYKQDCAGDFPGEHFVGRIIQQLYMYNQKERSRCCLEIWRD